MWANGGIRGLRRMQELVCSLHCRAAPALSSPVCSGAPPSLRFSSALFSSSTALLPLVPSVLGETRLSQASRGSCWVLSSLWHREAVGSGQLQQAGWARVLCSQPLVPLRAGLLLFLWSAAAFTFQFPEDQSLNCFLKAYKYYPKNQDCGLGKLMLSMCQNLLVARELVGDRRIYGKESTNMEGLYRWEGGCYIGS